VTQGSFQRVPFILRVDLIRSLQVKFSVRSENTIGCFEDVFKTICSETIRAVSSKRIETCVSLYELPLLCDEIGNRFLWLACKLWFERQASIQDCRLYPIRRTYLDSYAAAEQFFVCLEDSIFIEDFSIVSDKGNPENSAKLLRPEEKRSCAFYQKMYEKFYRETYFGILLSFREFEPGQEENRSEQILETLVSRILTQKKT
jgi:hypothetical protein